MNNLCECHGHLMMDGADYRGALRRHKGHVNIQYVRGELEDLRASGVSYFRDGGDACMVSALCRHLPADYGIEYVTPVFAIHKTGHYGSIVGRGFADLAEYRSRITEVAEHGGDFVKLIVSGILTFHAYGELSCDSLEPFEIREMIRIAHDAGFPVMIHANGNAAIRACIEGGADSVEHGYFQEQETLDLLASSDTVWVPTLAAIDAFRGRSGFDDQIVRETLSRQFEALRYAAGHGAYIACGSDSGAVGVPHGHGTVREMELLRMAGIDPWIIERGNKRIRTVFHSKQRFF